LLLDLGGEGAVVLTCHHVIAPVERENLHVRIPWADGSLGDPLPVEYDREHSRPTMDAVVLRVKGVRADERPLLHKISFDTYNGQLPATVLIHLEPYSFDTIVRTSGSFPVTVEPGSRWPDSPDLYDVRAFRLTRAGITKPGVSGGVAVCEDGVLGLVHFSRPETPDQEREGYLVPLTVWADAWDELDELIELLTETYRGPQLPLRLQTFRVSKPTRFHFRAQRVPFIGFELEITRLEEFLDSPSGFAWWMIIGEAGAGKSRLALELCQRLRRREEAWHSGFLPGDHDLVHWMEWQPKQPTLIVVDYAHSRAEELQAIVTTLEGRSEELHHPVRLLLLERPISEEVWWDRFLGAGTTRMSVESAQHDEIFVMPPMSDDQLWKSIVFILEQHGVHPLPSRDIVLESLRSVDPEGNPLFAAMAADALSAGRDIRDWDREALLRDVLQREEQLYWKPRGAGEKYKNLLALATLIEGINLSDLHFLEQHLPQELPTLKDGDPNRYDAKRYEVLVGQDSRASLAPLEPDLVGEYFVLQHISPRDDVDFMRPWELISVAWAVHPWGVFRFISRAVHDFPDHRSIKVLEMPMDVHLAIANTHALRSKGNLAALVATLANLAHADSTHGRVEMALPRLERLWGFAERWPENELVRKIPAVTTAPVIEGLIEAGDLARARSLTHSLMERLVTDPELAEQVVEAFYLRISVCLEEGRSEVAATLFEEACRFTERMDSHKSVAVLAERTPPTIIVLLEGGYWNAATRVLLATASLASLEPQDDIFVETLGVAAFQLLATKGQVQDDQLESRYSDLGQIFDAVGDIVYSNRFEEIMESRIGPDGVRTMKRLFDTFGALAYSDRGSALFQAGGYEEALEAYDRVVEIAPDDLEAWANKSELLIILERYEEALEAYEQTLALQPASPQAWNEKGWTLFKLGRYQDSLEASEKSLSLDPNFLEAWDTKSWALINLGKYREALEASEQSLIVDPGYVEAWQSKGVALANLQQDIEAVQWLCRAYLAREQLADSGFYAVQTLNGLGHDPAKCEPGPL